MDKTFRNVLIFLVLCYAFSVTWTHFVKPPAVNFAAKATSAGSSATAASVSIYDLDLLMEAKPSSIESLTFTNGSDVVPVGRDGNANFTVVVPDDGGKQELRNRAMSNKIPYTVNQEDVIYNWICNNFLLMFALGVAVVLYVFWLRGAAQARLTAAANARETTKDVAVASGQVPMTSMRTGAPALPIVYRSPKQIMADLDLVVIGQQAAKRGLANAAAQHVRRLQLSPEEMCQTDKSNVLLLGPTGCGKTLLTQALAQAINVPFYSTEATKFTASGYVGESVHTLLVGLLRSCNFDVERAQHGIIYLDEIDKKAGNSSSELDVGGESVQEELLTILEGTKVSVPRDGNMRGNDERVEIDTTNILFIAGGAFSGLGDIVSKRMASNRSTIGFAAEIGAKVEDRSRLMQHATAADFIAFGMIPEFIGRMPKRLVIEALSVDQLERILIEPKKALAAQKRLLLKARTDLRFTRGGLRAIAEEAHKTGTHGRALREIMEQVLEPIVFDEPTIAVVTADQVRNRHGEIQAKNRQDDMVRVPARLPYFIVDDDKVEETRQVVEEVAQLLRDPEPTERRRKRELAIVR